MKCHNAYHNSWKIREATGEKALQWPRFSLGQVEKGNCNKQDKEKKVSLERRKNNEQNPVRESLQVVFGSRTGRSKLSKTFPRALSKTQADYGKSSEISSVALSR